jgi:predicted GNAT family N-acyltransferase
MKVITNEIKYLDDVMNIINQAKLYFKNNSINQWQDGYPNSDSIISDINNHVSYVLIDNDVVIGTMYFHIGDDPTYKYIENGQWLTKNQKYGIIHRIAVDENVKGKSLALNLVNYAIKQCQINNINSIRIDTHKDNLSMQRFLLKNGFQSCGIIYLENGDQRIGFEKILS